jgi:hypothetical protein
MAISRMRKKASDSQYLKHWHNKQSGWCSECPLYQNCWKLGISVRNITDKMLDLPDTSENVLRLLQMTQIHQIYVVRSEKIKKYT